MSETYRLGFQSSVPFEHATFEETQWALRGMCPDSSTRTGNFVASDGEDVPYRLWRANKSRALLLLLHGAFDYSGAFDQIGPKFAQRGITSLAIDQRGFGATSSRGKWRGQSRMIRDAIEAIAFARKRYGEGLPIFLMGESMGAALAVHVASRAPELQLAGLVLAAPGAVSSFHTRLLGILLTQLLRLFSSRSGVTVERLSGWDFSPAAAIRLMSDPMVLRSARFSTLLGLFNLARSAVQEAEHVSVPVLTLAGAKDDVIRLSCIARLHERLAGEKEWVCFKQGPHLLLHWNKYDQVLRKAYSWIDARLADPSRAVAEPDRRTRTDSHHAIAFHGTDSVDPP